MRWLLPAEVSLARAEIAIVVMRPARRTEALRAGAASCIWTLSGPYWTAEVALEPPDEGLLNEWLVAGGLRPGRR